MHLKNLQVINIRRLNSFAINKKMKIKSKVKIKNKIKKKSINCKELQRMYRMV